MKIEYVSRKVYRLMKKYHINPKKIEFPEIKTPLHVCFENGPYMQCYSFPSGEKVDFDEPAVKSDVFIVDIKLHTESRGAIIYYSAPRQWMKCGRILNCAEYILPLGECVGILYSSDTDTIYCTSYPAANGRLFSDRDCFFCNPDSPENIMTNRKLRILEDVEKMLFQRLRFTSINRRNCLRFPNNNPSA